MMIDVGGGVLKPGELTNSARQEQPERRQRFIVVIHGWHVHSKGFNVHQLSATNYDEAQKEACWLNDQRDAPFDRSAYVVVEIDQREHLPRRLTWRERLTGKIQ
ncbi:hypothetical protein [Pseudomonas alkylphenolica]|uniref:Uncharacterized protein n=1 Tax=Pseudomonas alkylphenolica TaxID=237609 RepID=A0A077F6T8_9PSED|nr:hypothetical protein [Pseudomonas alkylphenolica]AIL61183.1 hypothetical protein PSAKL28_19610 [Pseudomonas alkylphenolica]